MAWCACFRVPPIEFSHKFKGWHLLSFRRCGSRVEHHALVPVAHRASHRSIEELHAQVPVLEDPDRLVRPDVFLGTENEGGIVHGKDDEGGGWAKRVRLNRRLAKVAVKRCSYKKGENFRIAKGEEGRGGAGRGTSSEGGARGVEISQKSAREEGQNASSLATGGVLSAGRFRYLQDMPAILFVLGSATWLPPSPTSCLFVGNLSPTWI